MTGEDKIKELQREIAVKHGIAVGHNDPIMILQTINDRLMQDNQAAQQKILASFKEEIEAVTKRWGDDAKDKAERILNAALVSATKTMAQGARVNGQETANAVRQEMVETTAQLSASIRDTRHIAYITFAASGMAIIAACLTMWSTL